jgi:hypothetical protein
MRTEKSRLTESEYEAITTHETVEHPAPATAEAAPA